MITELFTANNAAPRQPIACPDCRTPAVKWFDFGYRNDVHSYYHCESCKRSCAVQYNDDGVPVRQSPWVSESKCVSLLPKSR